MDVFSGELEASPHAFIARLGYDESCSSESSPPMFRYVDLFDTKARFACWLPAACRAGYVAEPISLRPSPCFFLMVLSLLSFCGCGRQAGHVPQGKNEASQTAASSRIGSDDAAQPTSAAAVRPGSTPREANIPLRLLALPGDELVQQAAASGWESESIGALAAAQLKALGKAMSTQGGVDQQALQRLVNEGFRCSLLRPQDLEVAYRDQYLKVLRPPGQAPRQPALLDQAGPAALRQAIDGLLEPLAQVVGAQLRFEQKVIRVDADATVARTRSLVQWYAEAPGFRLQQNMVWDCEFRRLADDVLELAALRVHDYEEVAATNTQPLFADVTAAAIGASSSYRNVLAYGFDYWLDRLEGRFGIFPTAWHGLAIGDVNGDGLDDVYVCEPGGLPNALFVRSSNGTATDVATESGVDLRDHTHSALLVDLDNDGDQDLALGTLVGVVIYENDGSGHFSRRTTKVTTDGMPFSLSAADFDHDGDLDLYVCCYSKRQGTVANQFVGIEGRPVPYHDANNGARNLLLLNNRRWQFPDVTQRAGLGQNNQRFSFAAAWEDYDNDGDQDLYVANDYGRNNLYRNDGGQFVDVASTAGVEDISAGMSVSWGDIDNDGWMDLYIANMFSSAGNRVTYQRRFQPSADNATRADFQRHARGNSLFKNVGNGRFNDVSESAGVTMGRWAWGSPLTDLNNDGLKDIVAVNGFITQELPDDL